MPEHLSKIVHSLLPPANDEFDQEQRYYVIVAICVYGFSFTLHLLFAFVFYHFLVFSLFWFNLFSTFLFATLLFLSSKGWHNICAAFSIFEVTLHAIFASYILGWEAGFHYYILILSLAPMMSPWMSFPTRLSLVVSCGIFYAVMWFFFLEHEAYNLIMASKISKPFGFLNIMLVAFSGGFIVFLYRHALSNMQNDLKLQKQRVDDLLHNVLPIGVAIRLKQGEENISDHIDSATVLFADIEGFTKFSSNVTSRNLVILLNQVFSIFDRLTEKHHVEKIKTLGDGYMVVSGLQNEGTLHAQKAFDFAHEMTREFQTWKIEQGLTFGLRVGLHSGAITAGVIGTKKFIYDVWGDTVNTAQRMESHGIDGHIHMSDETYQLLQNPHSMQPQTIDVKGKGTIKSWLFQV